MWPFKKRHQHSWRPVQVTNSNKYYTCWIISHCTSCGELKSEEHKGHTTLGAVLGEADEVAKLLNSLEK